MADIDVPGYLASPVENYLSGRILYCGKNEDPKEYIAIAGVPQDWVLGALVKNVLYNERFILPAPEETAIVGSADNLPVVIAANHLEDVGDYPTEMIRAVKI